MHKVRISFERPRDLVIELNDEEYAASQDEYSWEDFFYLMEDKFADHLLETASIDDVRDIL